jgi:AcrR family transcriptional regulator
MADPDRRERILQAALGCFLDKGFAATTIADIRGASGATTGSLYHFFPGKAAIAGALFQSAVNGWAKATEAAAKRWEEPQRSVRASVEGLVDWALAEPQLFRILDELRFLAGAPQIADALGAGWAEAERAYQAQVERREVRPLPWPIARAAMLGPAYDYLRSASSGRATLPPHLARRYLSDLAWASVCV